MLLGVNELFLFLRVVVMISCVSVHVLGGVVQQEVWH